MEEQNGTEEVKVSMLVDSLLLEKIKEIASRNNTVCKEEIHKALLEKVEKYENMYGPIDILSNKSWGVLEP